MSALARRTDDDCYSCAANDADFNGGPWTRTKYSYDAENRLMSATKTGSTVTYGYDPLGHRAKKTVSDGVTTTTTLYLGDAQDEEIAEYTLVSGAAVLVNRFVPGPAIDQPLAQISPAGVATYFHKDKLGSVIAMSGTVAGVGGTYVEGPYKYNAYGQGALVTGTPYKYTGRRLDGASGDTGLYYYRARYYSPVLGRFMQTDPVGMKDDVNLYQYAYGDPIKNTDPSGKCGPLCGAALGLVVYVAAQAVTGDDITLSGAVIATAGGAIGAGLAGNVGKVSGAIAKSLGKPAGTVAKVAGAGAVGASVGAGAQVATNGVAKVQGSDVPLTEGIGTATMIGTVAGLAAGSTSAAVAPKLTAAGKGGHLSMPASAAKEAADTGIGAGADFAGSVANNKAQGQGASASATSCATAACPGN